MKIRSVRLTDSLEEINAFSCVWLQKNKKYTIVSQKTVNVCVS